MVGCLRGALAALCWIVVVTPTFAGLQATEVRRPPATRAVPTVPQRNASLLVQGRKLAAIGRPRMFEAAAQSGK